jgi:SAM-dependent methyltransferase
MLAVPQSGPLVGRCVLCELEARFEPDVASGSLREGLRCSHCGCNARQRAAAIVLMQALAANRRARVYATEQASPFYLALRRHLPNLHGSEYLRGLRQRLRLSLWLWRQGVTEWVHHGDLTRLDIRDRCLDAIVSLDVLEHVPDHRLALRECARVLKPGGVLVLTVPFYEDNAVSHPLARLSEDGTIEHLAEPEYHGDPISGGVLCFHHFGWSLLADMREAGFTRAEACRVQQADFALPQGMWVLRASR